MVERGSLQRIMDSSWHCFQNTWFSRWWVSNVKSRTWAWAWVWVQRDWGRYLFELVRSETSLPSHSLPKVSSWNRSQEAIVDKEERGYIQMVWHRATELTVCWFVWDSRYCCKKEIPCERSTTSFEATIPQSYIWKRPWVLQTGVSWAFWLQPLRPATRAWASLHKGTKSKFKLRYRKASLPAL